MYLDKNYLIKKQANISTEKVNTNEVFRLGDS